MKFCCSTRSKAYVAFCCPGLILLFLPPPRGFLKLNIVGSVLRNSGPAGGDSAVPDPNGNVVFAATMCFAGFMFHVVQGYWTISYSLTLADPDIAAAICLDTIMITGSTYMIFLFKLTIFHVKNDSERHAVLICGYFSEHMTIRSWAAWGKI